MNLIAFDIKGKGSESEVNSSLSGLKDLINKTSQTNMILFALTELSMLLDSQRKFFNRNFPGKTFLDTLSILANAIGDKVLETDPVFYNEQIKAKDE